VVQSVYVERIQVEGSTLCATTGASNVGGLFSVPDHAELHCLIIFFQFFDNLFLDPALEELA